MSKKTISNLIHKEGEIFRANVKKFQRIITSSSLQENGGESGKIDCGQVDPISLEVDPISLEEVKIPCPTTDQQPKWKIFHIVENFDSSKVSSKTNEISSLLGMMTDSLNKICGILEKIEHRLSIVEANTADLTIHRSETMAQNTTMRECKVLLRRVHKSMCRLTGEKADENAIDVASSLPISSISGCIEVEEKLLRLEYEKSMKVHLLRLKGQSGELDDVLRSLFTDEFCTHYNFKGNFGKLSLMGLNLVSKTLFDVYASEGLEQFNKKVKRYIDLSHNRYRQRHHHEGKKRKIN